MADTLVIDDGSQTLTNKTIDGDSNTVSNIDIGNEATWATITDVDDVSAFESGDKLLAFEAGVGMKKIDYDNLPGAGGGISNVVEDTTPQLGGDLDLNGHAIDFPTTANVTDCLDEDDMASDSATVVATQQSIKKYVDDNSGGTVDTSGSPVDDDFAKFTDADTIEGRSYAEVKQDLGLEIGIDVLAEQTIGIADDNLVEIDDADAAANDYCKLTANGIVGRSYSETMGDLSGEASADFAMNTHKITGVTDPTGDQDVATKKYVDDNSIDNVSEDTTPDLGGTLGVGENGVKLDPVLGTNLHYSGMVEEGIAGYGNTAIGDLVYLASADGKWEKADADAEATTKPELGIALTVVAEDATVLILKYGYLRVDTFSITNDGAPLFASCTPGALGETAPSATGDQVRRVGSVYDASAHTIFFNPDNTWLEIA